MRKNFCLLVEKGRMLHGDFATDHGDRYGAFFLQCRLTGERLKIIVSDGSDWTKSGLPANPWEHVSVSCENRCPWWQEMQWVKELFFDDDETVMQVHPPKSDYINVHPHVLHLWKPCAAEITMPPKACV